MKDILNLPDRVLIASKVDYLFLLNKLYCRRVKVGESSRSRRVKKGQIEKT